MVSYLRHVSLLYQRYEIRIGGVPFVRVVNSPETNVFFILEETYKLCEHRFVGQTVNLPLNSGCCL